MSIQQTRPLSTLETLLAGALPSVGAAPDTPAAATAIAGKLAATVDRAKGGPVTRAFEKLLPPQDRYQANGIVAGTFTGDTLTTLDGEAFPATPAPVLRKWLAKHPEACERPARWIVYPRTLDGGLAFYVLGQRQTMAGETEAQLNRQIDRFTITGTLLNSRGQRKQTCIRICRNAPTPKGQKRHPDWSQRLLFLAGLPPAPTKTWWNTDVRIQVQRIGRELKILALEKVGTAATHQEIPLGNGVLPWPWKPSSQTIWRLCQREGLAAFTPWPCSDDEADGFIRHYLAVIDSLLTDIAPAALGRQAGRVDPDKRKELTSIGQRHMDLLRQWLARTNQFLKGLEPTERQGITAAHQLKQRLVAAMVVDLDGVLQIEGTGLERRFWFQEWPVRGHAARVLITNLPITQIKLPVTPTPPVEPEVAAPPAAKKKRTVKPKTTDEVIDQLFAQAAAARWPHQLLHLRVTAAIDQFLTNELR
ncbi:hypothetical protein KBY83_12085 [Cyanobium sp. WKJ7-Wakatipu]|uniref:hypothetical protein n=1 Tax=Cyanobium sp. WKJ7-Wakatipu TaxID=2823726 RepID=UPI0020CDD203|nr:hypothetical protein [Cyanobium sp. WKJ7-Wakatipu]MCP9784043.1 hypothetical protein [Cyanobium sp. WKJ7-Wakatipu]